MLGGYSKRIDGRTGRQIDGPLDNWNPVFSRHAALCYGSVPNSYEQVHSRIRRHGRQTELYRQLGQTSNTPLMKRPNAPLKTQRVPLRGGFPSRPLSRQVNARV